MTTRPRGPEAGFTLIEILLAVAITALAMVAVSGAFLGTLRARSEVEHMSTSSEAGQRILTLVERDLQGLWHHNIKDNKVLFGRDMDIGGYDADHIDFLTTTDAIGGTLDNSNQIAYPTLCEVGYWFKENQEIPGLLELWRREDPMVDDDILTDGHFQLVSDRIKSFNITYYETLGARAEEVREWDSSQEDKLPRRIKIEFTIHRKVGNRNEISEAEVQDFEKILKTYVRHFVFDRRYTDIMKPGIAMIPIAPPRPEQGGGGGGAAAPGGSGGGDGGGGEGSGGPAAITQTATRGQGGRGRGDGGSGISPTGGRGNPPPSGGFNLGDLLRGGRGTTGGGFGGLLGGKR